MKFKGSITAKEIVVHEYSSFIYHPAFEEMAPELSIGIVERTIERVPQQYELSQNYPNPFNPSTSIQFMLPQASHVNLSIYNLSGQLIEVLLDKYHNAGTYVVQWNATKIPSGIYFYQIKAGDFRDLKKMILMK